MIYMCQIALMLKLLVCFYCMLNNIDNINHKWMSKILKGIGSWKIILKICQENSLKI